MAICGSDSAAATIPRQVRPDIDSFLNTVLPSDQPFQMKPGLTVALTFTGDSIKVGVRKGTGGGLCDVFVDDVLVADDLSLYNSPDRVYQVILYEDASLASGTHTVRLEAEGSGLLVFDFFEYADSGGGSPVNTAPSVAAGADQSVTLPATATPRPAHCCTRGRSTARRPPERRTTASRSVAS